MFCWCNLPSSFRRRFWYSYYLFLVDRLGGGVMSAVIFRILLRKWLGKDSYSSHGPFFCTYANVIYMQIEVLNRSILLDHKLFFFGGRYFFFFGGRGEGGIMFAVLGCRIQTELSAKSDHFLENQFSTYVQFNMNATTCSQKCDWSVDIYINCDSQRFNINWYCVILSSYTLITIS